VQWLIDRGHNAAELWGLMQSGGIYNWPQWFRTGDPVATTTHWTQRCWPDKSSPYGMNWQRHHGVTIMEAIKTGPAWYRVSSNSSDKHTTTAALAWIDCWSRSPDGTFEAPDCITQIAHTPLAGVETCSVVEEMFSLRTAYETTGAVQLFDRLE